MRRVAPVVLLAVAVTFASCGRRAARSPATPEPAPPTDTAAQREAQERREREVADSLQRIRDSLAARPAPADTTAPPPPAAEAPPERCILDFRNLDPTRALIITDPVSRRRVTIVSGGIRGRCRNQDITIEADSAESYEQNNLHILIGNVRYREPRVAIDADRATYFRTEERLLLEQNVHIVLQESPGTIDGPRVEYYRAVQGVRDQPRFVAYERPTLTYVETDSAGRELPPARLNANVITGEGDSTFYASGQVVLTRELLTATGDSGMLDGRTNLARLMKDPVIVSRDSTPFTLRGRVIDIYGASRRVDRVIAIDSGHAESDELTLRADTIDLRVQDNQLERAFAFGTTGAHATTPQRDVIADSLDVIMPDGQLRELRAIGKAFAESDPDTTRVHTDERDWIRGDTIIALFDSTTRSDTATRARAAAGADSTTRADSSSQPQLRQLHAVGNASAYYQVPADSGNRERPGINYARGREIRLTFEAGEVDRVYVVDQASGIYLEPKPDSTAQPPSSAPRPPTPGTTRPPARRTP